MSLIQVAIIGAGGAGKYHAKTLLETGKYKLVAFCDTQEQARAGVEKDFPGIPFHNSLDGLFKKEKLDLVTIATPHNLHKEHAITAAKAGVNAIVEKPMATTVADALRIQSVALRSGTPVVVGHYWRRVHAIDRAQLGKGDQDLFKHIAPLAWHGLHGNVFCVDYSVGARWTARLKGKSPERDFKLAALRWPERVVQFDDGSSRATTGFGDALKPVALSA